jgi:uncharacterized membrane protein YdjX (TVP38/TMEM64 family)
MKWAWLAWALCGVMLEWIAIEYDQPTLSQTTSDLNRAWPPFLFVAGAVVGHLFWPLTIPKGG